MIHIVKVTIAISIFIMLSIITTAQNNAGTIAKPKLVVGIVVDQMRYDYLYRYNAKFTKGGFNRLLKDGYNMQQTYLDYIPSVTGCGHACIYTGTVPAIHGIAANDWYDKAKGKMQYCAGDNTVTGVGVDGKAGKMSPRNMLTTTITDELRLATNNQSKVIGVALKDRGSILPAGHMANGAYWMDDSMGNFVTSTYYTTELPNWIKKFNAQNKAKQYLSKDWNLFLHHDGYTQSTDDNTAYEGKFKNEKVTSFPHQTSAFTKYSDIKKTPFGNTITLDFAKESIIGEGLGMGNYTDFLTISLSSTDYIGHMYGINAMELEDCYYRLDADIELFLNFLDKQIGKGQYTVFLTADHGAAHNPQFLIDNKVPAGFLYGNLLKKKINDGGQAQFGKNVVVDMGDNQIWINDTITNKQDAINYVIKELKQAPEIQFILENEKIATAAIPAELKALAINGYNQKRSGDILFILNPAYIEAYNESRTGTTHGTWNPYDTHIPMLWYGTGIKKGSSHRTVHMTDIAPTIADLLNIPVPNGNIGKPMTEIYK